MNPNQQQPISTDYLEEIAAPVVESTGPSIKTIIIVGVSALILVLVIFTLLSSLTKGNLSSIERLAGKLYSTNNVVATTVKEKKIKDSKLRGINISLSLTLQDIIRDTTPGFAAKKINFEKIKDNKKIIAAENSTKLEETLEEARLNGNFDQVYAIEMVYATTNLKLLMEQVSKGSNSVEMQAALIKGIENLTPLIDQFQAFSQEARTAL